MKKYIYLILVINLYFNSILSATNIIKSDSIHPNTELVNPFNLAAESFGNNANYLLPIIKLKSMEEDYLQNGDKWMYLQAALTYNSFLANNKEYQKLKLEFYTLTNKTLSISAYDDKAIDYIKELCNDKQVVMINEQHWQPKHRYLGNILLKHFYDSGFRYLAVEAISGNTDSLNAQKYPIQTNGFYIKEPQFRNFITNALELGYKVISYDIFEKDREILQAKNIYEQTIKKDSEAKVLVWAGVGHIYENKIDYPMMAYYFKNLSNIDPFTIEQTSGDKDAPLLENHFLAINADTTRKNMCDLFIYNNFKENNFKINPNVKSKKINFTLPHSVKKRLNEKEQFIISIFIESEYLEQQLKAIPILNYKLEEYEKLTFDLPHNNRYKAILRDKDGKILFSKSIIL